MLKIKVNSIIAFDGTDVKQSLKTEQMLKQVHSFLNFKSINTMDFFLIKWIKQKFHFFQI